MQKYIMRRMTNNINVHAISASTTPWYLSLSAVVLIPVGNAILTIAIFENLYIK